MRLFAKQLLLNKQSKPQEQHIVSLAVARLNNLEYNEDFSIISVESQTGVTSTGYVYVYLDDVTLYQVYCYDETNLVELNVALGSSRYGIPINPKNFNIGEHILTGGVREIATGKTVQTFVINYTKVD